MLIYARGVHQLLVRQQYSLIGLEQCSPTLDALYIPILRRLVDIRSKISDISRYQKTDHNAGCGDPPPYPVVGTRAQVLPF